MQNRTIEPPQSDFSYCDYKRMANGIMFNLKERPDGFTAEDFYEEARKYQMPPDLMLSLCPKVFGEFEQVGYTEKTGRTVSSSIHAYDKLEVWVSVEVEKSG